MGDPTRDKCYRFSSEREKRRKRAYYKAKRLRVLRHYSNGDPKCACCGCDVDEFLCLNHINGGGSVQRETLGAKMIFAWIIKNNFPPGFNVLCHNCNASFGAHGYCPHEKIRVLDVQIKELLEVHNATIRN